MDNTFSYERPKSVTLAVGLLYATFVAFLGAGICFVLFPQNFIEKYRPVPTVQLLFPLIVISIVYLFFIVQISAGRNWARIIFGILCVVGIWPELKGLPDHFSYSTVSGMFHVFQGVLQVAGIALLFTPQSNDWFE
jgi:hypothetical protein